MTEVEAYFPQPVFGPLNGRAPRVFASPAKYIQGDGVLDNCAVYLSLLKNDRVGLLASKRGLAQDGIRVTKSLESGGSTVVSTEFNGECSIEEINLHVANLASASVDCLIAMGGGKCVDAGKCIAYRLGVPVVIVPTLASNDAPCSSVSVIYDTNGVFAGAEFFPDNPALVIMDTGVVAMASERYLVAGMGDAMATWYEARACVNNPQAASTLGGRPTLASMAIGEICAKTLFAEGKQAAEAVAKNQVNDSLEKVVEANTLLSGLGFESGGLAVAHSVAQSYTALSGVHEKFLHGEMVAMGTLTQLVMESEAEARQVAEFCALVGLPVHLGQLGLDASDDASLDIVVAASMESPFIHNMTVPITAEFVKSSILDAHNLGLRIAKEKGDDAWRRLHQSE